MTRIRVTAEPAGILDAPVLLDERIVTSDLHSDHFARASIERIG